MINNLHTALEGLGDSPFVVIFVVLTILGLAYMAWTGL